MFDYSGYREVERDNESYGTCDRFSKLHLIPFLCEAALNFLDLLFVSFFVSFAPFAVACGKPLRVYVRHIWRIFKQNWYKAQADTFQTTS
ncbi:hypothetical protein [Nostoc sp.]|uniref:hypothetical protein n=1 Tax=Nostoc sp. TaxID=1180 RepID=UPI002FF4AB26